MHASDPLLFLSGEVIVKEMKFPLKFRAKKCFKYSSVQAMFGKRAFLLDMSYEILIIMIKCCSKYCKCAISVFCLGKSKVLLNMKIF